MALTDKSRNTPFLVHVLIGTGRFMILYLLVFSIALAGAYAQGRLDVDSFFAPASIAAFFAKALPLVLLFSLSLGWARAMRKSDTETVVATGLSGALICSTLCTPLFVLAEFEGASSLGGTILILALLMFAVSCLIIFGLWWLSLRNMSEPL